MPNAEPPLRASSDAALLRILGAPHATAHRAIERLGSLRSLLAVPRESFRQRTGLSDELYLRLHAARELARRDLSSTLRRGQRIQAPTDCYEYVLALCRDLPYESVLALWLTGRNHILASEELFHGTRNAAPVYPREVLRRAMELNACRLILVHNHVDGDPSPTDDDFRITEQLVRILALAEIQVLDHLIVGDGLVLSLRQTRPHAFRPELPCACL